MAASTHEEIKVGDMAIRFLLELPEARARRDPSSASFRSHTGHARADEFEKPAARDDRVVHIQCIQAYA
jgi:hypothetical protein